MRYLYTLMTLISLNLSVSATEINTNIRGQSQQQYANDSLLFPAEDSRVDLLAVDFSYENNGFRLATTAWSEQQNNINQSEIELSELFYDFSAFDWKISVGKKKVDWDVGYGFRPLDMFSPTDTLALYTAVSPGAWLVSGDWFTEVGTVSLLCNETQQNYSEAGIKTESGIGCGGRYYRYYDDWEMQWLYHYDSQVKNRIGFSALSVLSDSLEFHSSILWQQAYRGSLFQPLQPEDTGPTNLVTVEDKYGALQLLTGFNFSLEGGTNIILEYWFDGRSPSDKQWREFINGIAQRHEIVTTNPSQSYLFYAQQQMFSGQNLFQHNLMLHLRSKSGSWQVAFTALLNPVDKGLLLDPRLSYYSLGGHKFEIGVRYYLGSDDSIYRQLENTKLIYLGAEFVL